MKAQTKQSTGDEAQFKHTFYSKITRSALPRKCPCALNKSEFGRLSDSESDLAPVKQVNSKSWTQLILSQWLCNTLVDYIKKSTYFT